ncbi:unnamed protein product [Macrosiphum euphorbiae]|uniref:Acetyl-coenzyme A transporter 1 n=1 Tax=Macrosiphum euphorbiae TaxID=13131 RepID=A0AAV0XDH3_9HEMI|nr:unnamed protein product [Macrosiphum euphorbiae]
MLTIPKTKYEPGRTELATESFLIKPNLKGDWLNFFMLLLLYTMQGLPLGLSSAIPILLQSKKDTSYQDQALFSLVIWPFSLKLLWAPLLDSLYVHKIGKRKSWLIPVQYLIGTILLYLGSSIDILLPETGKPNVMVLVYLFFITNFLSATQDIAVDGWALTMLNKNNVGYASTCNTSGQIIGVMIGSVFAILFTSEDFSNKYLRITTGVEGIVSMKTLLYIWGILFMLITTMIAIFKKEKDNTLEDGYVKLNISKTYSLLWDIMKLPSIRILAIALLTARIGFAATDSISTLKLIDAGVSKDDIMVINTAMYVVKMIIPLIIAKYTSGPKPLSLYLKVTPIRLLWNIVFIVLIYYTPTIITTNGIVNIPVYYYAILIFILSIQEVLSYMMFVAILAFFSRISDPRFGGTYMTLLNTLSNLGFVWSSTVALQLVDLLTSKECSFDSMNNCSTLDLQNICKANEGNCIVTINGYYVEIIPCTIIGIAWYIYFRNILKNLQIRSPSHWLINVKKPVVENIEESFPLTVTV